MQTVAKERALLSRGLSSHRIYEAITRELEELQGPRGGTLIDVGCGRGYLWAAMARFFDDYIGVDVARYEEFPSDLRMVEHDLDQPGIPLEEGSGDVVICCETTPCLENPRNVVRECARLVKPGGWLVVTNPNNLSALSLITILSRKRFNAFQHYSYPYMITALLEGDLLRMAQENGLVDARIFYTLVGRIAFTNTSYPKWLAKCLPRLCSDHVGLIARKPTARMA